MKFFALILTIYVLLLSSISFCWEENCNEDVIENSAGSEQEQSDDPSTCSPFFSCGTCVGFTLTVGLDIKDDFCFIDSHYTPYQDIYFDCVPMKIWQPPKLS